MIAPACVLMAFPEKGKLCEAWDGHGLIREQMRSKLGLLSWTAPATTGVANRSNLVLNRFVVQKILEVWVPFTDAPKSPPIEWLRSEVSWVLVENCMRPAFLEVDVQDYHALCM